MMRMKTGTRRGAACLAAVLCAGLFLLAGCKDFFHPEGPAPKKYTVTFDADGGSPVTQTRTVTEGGSVGPANMPSEPDKNGYIFGGWHTAADGGGSEFTASTTVTGNITVYAKWTAVQYTVTFDAAGGSPATQTGTAANGGSVGAANMPPEPEKSG